MSTLSVQLIHSTDGLSPQDLEIFSAVVMNEFLDVPPHLIPPDKIVRYTSANAPPDDSPVIGINGLDDVVKLALAAYKKMR